MSNRSNWTWGLGILAVLVVGGILLIPPGARRAFDARLTTHRTTPDGAAALYETLEELGIPVSRRVTPLVGADPIQGPLAILAPSQPLSPAEVRALLDWVEAGGRVILAPHPSDPLLPELGLSVRFDWSDRLLGSGDEHPWVRGVEAGGVPSRVFVDTAVTATIAARLLVVEDSVAASPEADTLVGSAGTAPVVLLVHHGVGAIIAVSDPGLLANHRIAGSGLAPVVARAAAEWTDGGAVLWFDEYHHGHRGGSLGAGLRGFLTGHPAGQGMLYLSLVALLALGASAIRLGRPVSRADRGRRSPVEHVSALGEAYRQARADQVARRRLVAGFARRIGRERPRPGGEALFLERIQARVPSGREAVASVASGWRDEVGVLELARRIDRAVHRLTGDR